MHHEEDHEHEQQQRARGGRDPPERGAGFSRTLIFARRQTLRRRGDGTRGPAPGCSDADAPRFSTNFFAAVSRARGALARPVAPDTLLHRDARPRNTGGSHITMSSTDASNREDTFGAGRRGEDTSRLETRLESAMEEINEEDNPMLAKSIKAAQAADESAKGEWLAACADGGVKKMQGEPDAAALMRPAPEDNDGRAQAAARADEARRAKTGVAGADLACTHRSPTRPTSSRRSPTTRAPSATSLRRANGLGLLRHHMRALSAVHLETYFCELDAEKAPFMLSMVTLADLPPSSSAATARSSTSSSASTAVHHRGRRVRAQRARPGGL